MANKLTIIRGLPGSGKSTYAKSRYNCLILENDVVVANTFTKRSVITSYITIADRYGADYEVVRCSEDHGNIHDVPRFVLESMKRGFEDWPGEKIV